MRESIMLIARASFETSKLPMVSRDIVPAKGSVINPGNMMFLPSCCHFPSSNLSSRTVAHMTQPARLTTASSWFMSTGPSACSRNERRNNCCSTRLSPVPNHKTLGACAKSQTISLGNVTPHTPNSTGLLPLPKRLRSRIRRISALSSPPTLTLDSRDTPTSAPKFGGHIVGSSFRFVKRFVTGLGIIKFESVVSSRIYTNARAIYE